MIAERELKVLNDALKFYGISHQETKAIEEMSELTKEICKYKDGAKNTEAIAEEVADTLIMIEQLMLYYRIIGKVEYWRDYKLRRLEERMRKLQNGGQRYC